MRRLIIIVFAFLLLLNWKLPSQTVFPKSNTFIFDFGFHYSTSGSFFDSTGKLRVYQVDSLNYDVDSLNIHTKYTKKYSWDYREYIINLGLRYGLTKDLSVMAEMPLMINTLSEDYSTDTFTLSPTFGLQTQRADFSLFMPQYYKFGTMLRLDSGIVTEFIKTEFKIPPKFRNGYQNDTTKGLYKYASYELLISANAILQFEKSWLEAGMMYNFRGGLFHDQFVFKLEGGFTSVPNTSLHGMIIYCQDMGSFNNAIPYNQRKTTIQEDYFDAGVAFRANLTKFLFADFSYLIRFGIKNTLSGGKLMINTGFSF